MGLPSSAALHYFAAPPSKDSTTKSNAQVAQLVEQLAFNQLVLGSNPSLRTFPHPHRQSRGAFLFPPPHTKRQQAGMMNPLSAAKPGLTADFALAKIHNKREAHFAWTERSGVNALFAFANLIDFQNPEEDSALRLGGTE